MPPPPDSVADRTVAEFKKLAYEKMKTIYMEDGGPEQYLNRHLNSTDNTKKDNAITFANYLKDEYPLQDDTTYQTNETMPVIVEEGRADQLPLVVHVGAIGFRRVPPNMYIYIYIYVYMILTSARSLK